MPFYVAIFLPQIISNSSSRRATVFHFYAALVARPFAPFIVFIIVLTFLPFYFFFPYRIRCRLTIQSFRDALQQYTRVQAPRLRHLSTGHFIDKLSNEENFDQSRR